jgi:hypothetical protein
LRPAERHRIAESLRDDRGESLSLGCQNCVAFKQCGGLRTSTGLVNGCRDLCECLDPATCNWVCSKHPIRYYLRNLEVGGFDFDDIPSAPSVPFPTLGTDFVSIVQPWMLSTERLSVPLASIHFSNAFAEEADIARALTRNELAARFGVAATQLILTGVESDERVERWWRFKERRGALEDIQRSGVVLATTPNFSTMVNVPRPNDLHALKQILICWEEIQTAGITCAVHLNGRTDEDFKRLAKFVRVHSEINSVSFEFLTGARRAPECFRAIERLRQFALSVDRPLVLVLRGGREHLESLLPLFRRVLYLNASAHSKTHSRQ